MRRAPERLTEGGPRGGVAPRCPRAGLSRNFAFLDYPLHQIALDAAD